MKPEVKYLLECYMQERLFVDEETLPSGAERSAEPVLFVKKYSDQLILPEDVLQFVQPDHDEFRNVANGQLNEVQRQQIHIIVRNLKSVADSLHLRHQRSLLSVERAILHNEGLNEDELRIVRRLHSITSNYSVSAVADCLNSCLTSRTLRAALRFMCYSASSVSQELALTCELSQIILPRVRRFVHSDSIYNVINDFIEERLSAVHDL